MVPSSLPGGRIWRRLPFLDLVRNLYQSQIFVPSDGPDSGPRFRCPNPMFASQPEPPALSTTLDVTDVVCATTLSLPHLLVATSSSRGRSRSMTK